MTSGTSNYHSKMNGVPKLIVFDLDYTLWPFWIDTHVNPPFLMDRSPGSASYGRVIDSRHKEIKPYLEVPKMLEQLYRQGFKMALASRTGSIEEARSLVNMFGWNEYFISQQIFPADKQAHFQRIQSETGIQFQHMIFFDDERRNIDSVSKLGVTCLLVERGMSLAMLQVGLEHHRRRWSAGSSQ